MGIILARARARLREAAGRAGEIARDVLVGGNTAGPGAAGPAMSTASRAFVAGVYRKLIAAAVGGLIAWLHVSLGWDVVAIFGDDFELGLINAITAYLVWRLPNSQSTEPQAAP